MSAHAELWDLIEQLTDYEAEQVLDYVRLLVDERAARAETSDTSSFELADLHRAMGEEAR